MLQTMEEMKKADLTVGPMINGVDNPNLQSVDSTAPIQTTADVLEEKEERKEEKKEVSPKSEVKTEKEVKVETPLKKEEVKKEDPIDKRIGKLTKNWRTAERERDFERKKRQEAEDELKKLQAKVPATDRPKKEDFEDEDAYFEALTDWKIDSKLRVSNEEIAGKIEEKDEKQAIDATFNELDTILDKGRDKYEDFDQVVLNKDLVITQEMTETILLSDIADDLMYYLGQNPDEALEISKMSPLKAARELGKIESKLETGAPTAKEEEKEEKEEKEEEKKETPPQKKTTKAPEPIVPVKATGTVDKDPKDMSPREYRAWREKNKE